jgi:hypothetical protein
MSKLKNKIAVAAASVVLALSAITPASATTWVITDVLSVSSGGFGASSFHDARGNVMSGSIIANLPQSAASGIYDDVTGTLSLTATVTQGGNTFSMTAASTSGFLFTGGGFLSSNSTMDLSFSDDLDMLDTVPTILSGTVTEMGFKLGDVCCSGGISNGNPNSFAQLGGTNDERFMTLWGANNFDVANGTYHNGSESTLGMDIRIKMERAPTNTEVPAPAATVIFGFGLMGLAYMRRRKTV